MVLPIFLVLFCAAFYLGVVALRQVEADVIARNKTWYKRFSVKPPPFEFKNGNAGRVSDKVSLGVKSGIPMFDKINTTASGEHILIGGTWDYTQVNWNKTDFPFKSPVNRLITDAAVGKASGLLDNYADMLQGIANTAKEKLKELENELKQSVAEAQKALQEVKDAIQKTKDEIAQIKKDIDALKNTLSDKLSQIQGLGPATLNNLLNSPEFTKVRESSEVFKDTINRVENMSKEERQKLENARDNFIYENRERLQQLKEQQLQLDAQNSALDIYQKGLSQIQQN